MCLTSHCESVHFSEVGSGARELPHESSERLFIKTHGIMDGPDNLNLLSKHRSLIMGIAMMMILLHHLYFVSFPCNALALNYGMLGVDIFLFLSGFGIFFSLAKSQDKSIGSFYRRRLVRIFPAAILAGILVTIPCGGPTCQHWSLCLTGLNLWYIRSILLLYLIAPFLFCYYRKFHAGNSCFFILASTVILATILLHRVLAPHFSIYHPLVQTVTWTLCRSHAFAIGMFLAMRAERGMPESGKLWITVAALLSLPALVEFPHILFSPFKFHHYVAIIAFPSLLPLLIVTTVLVCRIAEHAPALMLAPLKWVGTYSLEIYLVHEAIFYVLRTSKLQVNGYMMLAIAIGLSLLAAWLLHWLSARLMGCLAALSSRMTTESQLK